MAILCFILIFMPMLICGSEVRSRSYRGEHGRKIQNSAVLETQTVRSRLGCTRLCSTTDGCASVSFELTTNTCMMSRLTKAEMSLYTDVTVGWSSYSNADSDWLLVFRAPKGIGGDVYTAFVNATGVSTDPSNCADLTSTACQTNYRHPILDDWITASFAQVRFSFYKNQAEVAFLVFDATGSNLTSWFAKERILNSSWPTSATDTYVAFTLEGDIETWEFFASRRFSIYLNYGDCGVDRMYAAAIVDSQFGCHYDIHGSYPQFIYAATGNPAFPESETGSDLADFVAISVKSYI